MHIDDASMGKANVAKHKGEMSEKMVRGLTAASTTPNAAVEMC